MISERQAQQIAWICDHADDMRALADRKGVREELEGILGELGEPAADVPTLLSRTAELLRRCGVPGALRAPMPTLADAQGGHPLEEFYLCPRQEHHRCTRLVHAFGIPDGTDAPACGIAGLPLRLRRF
ncbi:hypothetical protein HLK59_05810 [Streptomyces sp. S3(2020)]|uniref:hypothetical protein n=1 Tax=Streptomyces sp. S3(2020) TaxID=2732044 RepID=UPI00148940C4|nr:hypothetical protein [Streptomyces sp. S3(2020)]NNN29880.1 hypothetical protein [Streptomyces sp. S3(2020)]